MKIDLFKLNNLNYVDLDTDITFDENIFNDNYIRGIKKARITGKISINYDNELESDLLVSGEFILPCAVTLEDVYYPFQVKIEENIGKFEDFYNKNKNTLDILPFIWENIVSEVPIKVVKEGAVPTNTKGEGWELISD